MFEELPWESVNTLWIAAVVANLNQMLPQDRFRAFAKRHLGPQVEADVAEFESLHPPGNTNGAVATLPETYAHRRRSTRSRRSFRTMSRSGFPMPYDRRRLVAVIEFVSPGNKKEADERTSFVAKMLHLPSAGDRFGRRGCGDLVHGQSPRRTDALMDFQATYVFAGPTPIYAVSYRPVHRPGENTIDLWPATLDVGRTLPTMPLPLKGPRAGSARSGSHLRDGPGAERRREPGNRRWSGLSGNVLGPSRHARDHFMPAGVGNYRPLPGRPPGPGGRRPAE